MKLHHSKPLPEINGFLKLKNQDWLEKQRVAGKVAASCLVMLEKEVRSGTNKSMIELDRIAGEFICDNGCQVTFFGYKGFPGNICVSINEQLVHGIPTERRLQEGDLVSFDLGATYQNCIADTAITIIFGEARKPEHTRLVLATEEALMKGIAAIKVGNRLGCIGNAIYRSARGNGFEVITQYGGHGIDTRADGTGQPHAPPFVSNKASLDEGIRIQPGLVIAIEPLLCTASTQTVVDQDGWTVKTLSGISAHYEHSVYVHEDHVEIITDRSGI